jgi:hypothetical protein
MAMGANAVIISSVDRGEANKTTAAMSTSIMPLCACNPQLAATAKGTNPAHAMTWTTLLA